MATQKCPFHRLIRQSQGPISIPIPTSTDVEDGNKSQEARDLVVLVYVVVPKENESSETCRDSNLCWMVFVLYSTVHTPHKKHSLVSVLSVALKWILCRRVS